MSDPMTRSRARRAELLVLGGMLFHEGRPLHRPALYDRLGAVASTALMIIAGLTLAMVALEI